MIIANDAKVRTDPLVFSQTGPCLSDHVHRFYGAVSPRTMRPEVTFADLRAATGNTGNVEENKSLYWNPVIYKVMISINPHFDATDREMICTIYACQGAEPRRVPHLPAGPRLVRLRLLHLEDRRGPSFPRGAQDAGERRAAVPAHGHVRGAARLRARGRGRLRGAHLGPDQRHPAGARVPR